MTKYSNPNVQPIGWQFTEALDGHISVDPHMDDFSESSTTGKGSSCSIKMFLTVELYQRLKGKSFNDEPIYGAYQTTKEFVPLYEGKCIGTASCFALSKNTLRITKGKVLFFASCKSSSESTVISYHLHLDSVEGTPYVLRGEKIIDSNISLSISKTWAATTTLNLTVSTIDGARVGRGRVSISFFKFLRQMKTFRKATNLTNTSSIELILSLLAFFFSFAMQLSVFFFRPFIGARFPESKPNMQTEWKKRPSRFAQITAKDGVKASLEIFEPANVSIQVQEGSITQLPPVLCLPGVTGVGAEYNLYALPFLRCNVVDYFTARGHRCYALTPRWGCEVAVAEKSTVYDCRLDVAAALQYISKKGSQKPYVVGHCQGSVSLAMGLLDGTISRNQILGVTANSVFMNEAFAYWNSIKGRTTVLIDLYEYLAGNFFPVSSGANDTLFQRVLDLVLRFYPVGRRRDLCTSTACHRCSFGFGLLWNHENLDKQIHDNIHHFFTGTHTTILKHVVRMGARGKCLDNNLKSLVTNDNLERLRGLPILFISGTENDVFDPETTLADYELLRRRFGEENYRRFLPDGYGHLDPIVGKNAAEEVYWRIFEHLKWCINRPESVGC
jgi:hypothetical protein